MNALNHIELLAPATRELLRKLGAVEAIDDFYLAGSAALALHIGHRPVRSLDLMSATTRLRSAERRDLLSALLAADPKLEVETARDGYLFVRAGGDVGLRLYYYPYPLIDPAVVAGDSTVASLVDLGLMKLAAIISRGSRRDFVDLYLLSERLPLDTLLARAPDKFGHVRDFPLQALKGLSDLSLVDGEPLPALVAPLEWRDVERWVRTEVRRCGGALGLE